MSHAVIIHGWEADSTSNWFPWLASELRKKVWQVDVPDFPNTSWPQLTEWLEFFEKNIETPRRDVSTIVIGHSLGVPFILRWLEKDSRFRGNDKVNAAYLVAGFHKPLGYPALENFVDRPFNWETIKKACEKFIVINSDNDPPDFRKLMGN